VSNVNKQVTVETQPCRTGGNRAPDLSECRLDVIRNGFKLIEMKDRGGDPE
jgi:hypothetical protein